MVTVREVVPAANTRVTINGMKWLLLVVTSDQHHRGQIMRYAVVRVMIQSLQVDLRIEIEGELIISGKGMIWKLITSRVTKIYVMNFSTPV